MWGFISPKDTQPNIQASVMELVKDGILQNHKCSWSELNPETWQT